MLELGDVGRHRWYRQGNVLSCIVANQPHCPWSAIPNLALFPSLVVFRCLLREHLLSTLACPLLRFSA